MRLRINRKHMSQPHGGWGYPVPDGPVLNADTVDALVEKLSDYREANGQPVGEPEHDIAKHHAAKWPWLIEEIEDADVELNEAEAWIHRVWRSPPLRQAETRAREERFSQCLKCVHFEPLDTESLTNEAARRLLCLNPAKHRPEHGWCLLRGWIPSVAVQIQDPWEFADWTGKDKACWLDKETKTDITK